MEFLREMKYAVRSLSRNVGFSAVVILTLALGIGANTAIFSFVNAILLRPAPFHDMERLVKIESVRGSEDGRISMLEIQDIREQVAAVESIAAYIPGAQYNASGGGRPEEIPATLCTRNLFDVLGVPLHMGGLWPREYDTARNFGIIINYELWKRRFGGDPHVIGKKITLDAAPYYGIFGVLPPGIRFPEEAQMFRSLYINEFLPNYKDRGSRRVFAIARLKQGVSYEQASSQLRVLSDRLSQAYPDTNRAVALKMTPLIEQYVGNIRPYLLLLLGVVGFVLLIACANVINLLLTRSLPREKDVAIRCSLGAGRWKLAQHVVTETLLLSSIGGVLGVLFAIWGVQIINRLIHIELPPWMIASVDNRVLLFAFSITALTGLISGLLPAFHASRTDLNELLKEGTRGSSLGSSRHTLRKVLAGIEICLALILLVGAGLMIRTFLHLQQVDLGFNPDRIATFRFALAWRTYETLEHTERFVTQLISRIEALPGVEDAAATTNLPLSGETEEGRHTFTLEGQNLDEYQRNPYINDIQVTPGYFRLAGIPLVKGRFFHDSDHKDAPRAGILSQALADRMWPGEEALGKRLKIGPPDSKAPWTTVIGVVGNVKHENVTGDEGLDFYVSYRQVSAPNMYVLIKGGGNPASLVEQATRAVWSIDPDQSTFDAQTMEQRIAAILWHRRISGFLVMLFAVLAVSLAGIGIYGVMSYSVSQRTREIGIRLALGAQRSDVRKMVLREVLTLTIAGGSVGILGAYFLSRFMQVLFYQVTPGDPVTYVAVPSLLFAVAIFAGLLPAIRASRVSPIEALRYE